MFLIFYNNIFNKCKWIFLVTYKNSKLLTALNMNDNSTRGHFDNGNFQIELNSLIKTFSENNGNYFGGANNEDMTTIVATTSATETTAAVLKAFANATSSLTIVSPPPLSTINSETLVLDRILSNKNSFVLPVSAKTSNRYFFQISSKKLFSYNRYSVPNSTTHNSESQSFYESNLMINSLNTNGEEQGIKIIIKF